MSKKILAIAITLLMILSVVSVITPAVKADTPGDVTVFLRPGVEDPYKPGWSQTLGTLREHPEEVTNKYLDYAILASTETSASIGDLQFDITLQSTFQGGLGICIPPEFEFLKPDGTPATTSSEMRFNVWTDITNDYNFIWVGKRGGFEAYCPLWTRVVIGFPGAWGPDNDAAPLAGTVWDPGTYHVRIMNLKAPTVAGVYHFKIGVSAYYPLSSANAFDVNDWPIIIVKSELNPAYISGIVGLCLDVPCATLDTSRYGKVTAEGTTSEGRTVSAAYYFAPEDASGGVYNYWLFGLAEGSYTLSASAGAFPKQTGERVTVLAGQSMHLKSMWLSLGPWVDVTVYSKHGRGELPWGSLWQPPYGTNDPTVNDDLGRPRPIRVDLYDAEGNWLAYASSSTDPLATSYEFSSVGPAIEWTANVPNIGGAHVNGFVAGAQYKIESYVTGYVMTEDDAWQRTFTVASASGGASWPGAAGINVAMDLRRSNWFAITVHINELPTVPTTLVLAAQQDGTEKGVTSLLVNSNGDLWFWDSGYADYGPQVNPNTGTNYNILTDAIILEGWSYRYLYTQYEDDPTWKAYGFQPGTYDIAMYMADMGDQTGAIYGTPGVIGRGWYTIRAGDAYSGSIALCNSPTGISFRTRTNSLTLRIRSVDWESPAHPKPWTFPGAEIGFDILDTEGNVAESLDKTLWGVVQDDGTIGSFYAYTDDDAINPPLAGEDTQLTVVFTGNDPGFWGGWGPDAGLAINYIGYYPTHLAPGEYKYSVNTYGYLERGSFPNVLMLGGKANIQVDLIQGSQIRVLMDFYKENMAVDFNGWVRVEVFNENDELVGASVYGMAEPNPASVVGLYGGTGSYEAYLPDYDWKVVAGPAEGAGSDVLPNYSGAPYGQRAYFSQFFYGVPTTTFAGWYLPNPIDANRLEVPAGKVAAFDVYGFYWYFGGASSRNQGLWANGFDTVSAPSVQTDTGLRGSSSGAGVDAGGMYKVKVWALDPLGPDNLQGTLDDWQSYYMASDITGVDVPWGGATVVSVDLLQMGRLTGYAGWTDMYGNALNMPWLQISAAGETTVLAYTTPMYFGPESSMTSESAYFMWLPAGTYDVTAQATVAPQIFSTSGAFTVSVSPGFSASQDIGVTPTGVPVPEFALAPLVALSALAASLYVLRRRRK
jgi:hypothetical protein